MREGIYRYTVGGFTRYADPREKYVKMVSESSGRLGELIQQIRQGETVNIQPPPTPDYPDDLKPPAPMNADMAHVYQQAEFARDELVRITRSVFGLFPIEATGGNGFTWAEVLTVAYEFLAYLGEQKKSTVMPLTCSGSSEDFDSENASGSYVSLNPTTPQSSVCGSTRSVSVTLGR